MSDDYTYCLYSDEVPEPPEGTHWFDRLRWLMAVMNNDDATLGFVAGCFSHLLKTGELSDRQLRACEGVDKRVMYEYRAGVLDCQLNEPNPCNSRFEADIGLEGMEPEGEA